MSTIPVAIPASVPRFVLSVCSQTTGGAIYAGFTGLESVFYASLKAGETGAKRVVKWLRKTSIEQINQIQAIFNSINAIAILFYLKKFISEWSLAGRVEKIVSLGAAAISGFALYRFTPRLNLQLQQRGEVTIAEEISLQQKIAKYLHGVKIIVNLALGIVSKNRFWFVVGLLGTGYSYLGNLNFKWISFARRFPLFSEIIPITQAKVTYKMLALKPKATSNEEDVCTICLSPGMDTSFCADHVFHADCMAQHVAHNTDQYIRNARFLKLTTRRYVNGVYTGDSHSYSVTIPQENLPSCPNCRDYPLQNRYEIEVADAYDGVFNASVNIKGRKDRQPLFETLYSIYSVAQAGLAYLQKYPELAATIFKVQQVLMIVDIAGLALTLHYLCKQVKRKLNVQEGEFWKNVLISTTIVVGALAFSYLILGQLRIFLRSSIILKDLLAKLPISADLLKNIEVNWGSPFAFRLMQQLYMSRMVSSIALSFFSQQRMTNLLSALGQFLSLAGISRLQWIDWTQNLSSPLANMVEKGGTLSKSLDANSLKSLKVTAQYMVHPSCTKDPDHLSSLLQSLYQSSDRILDKSDWHRYWLVTYQNGFEVSRRLIYSATLQKPSLDPCGCTLLPNLSHVNMSGIDSYYGAASVTTSYK